MTLPAARLSSLALLALVVACSSTPGPTSPSPPSAAPALPTSPTTSAAPPASAGHSLVYAAHLGMVVLVNAGLGGATKPSSSTPTSVWGWNGTDWRVLDSSGPPIRNLAGVAYDTRRNVLVMHGGGYDLGRVYGDTWEWSGSWRQVSAAGPGVRDHTQLAFDQRRGRAVLFGGGGENPSVSFADTWEYDGSSWTRMAADGPQARVHHAMYYDAAQDRVVLAGGATTSGATLGDTWTWDGSRWTPSGSISPRSQMRMTFHRGLGSLLMVAGQPASAGIDLMQNIGASWMALRSSTEPPARTLTDMAVDEARGVLVLFGGANPSGTTVFNDTWEFNGSNWRRAQ